MDKERVCIITTFQEFLPGYSLTGIVKDQITMLLRNGHEVDLIVNEEYYGEEIEGVNLVKGLPFIHLYDYMELDQYNSGISDEEWEKFSNGHLVYSNKEKLKAEHHRATKRMIDMLINLYEEKKYTRVFTHDIIFTGWNLPYAVGLAKAQAQLPEVRWFNWIHSVPSGFRDYWNARWYGNNSKLIFPNHTDLMIAVEQFRGYMTDARAIPHIKDIRTFAEFNELTVEIIDKFPSLMSADVTQVYPASSDRLSAKGVKHVISIFAGFKKLGLNVSLLIANQHATGKQRKESIDEYMEYAKIRGLDENEFAFTSELCPDYEVGLPIRTVRELLMITNLLIFPTREESFGLVVPEAALMGNMLVLNKSLTQQYEVGGNRNLFFDFGAYRNMLREGDLEENYYDQVASIIAGRMGQNEAIMATMYARQRYNMDSLYDHYYRPLMSEAYVWNEQVPNQTTTIQDLIDKGVITVEEEIK